MANLKKNSGDLTATHLALCTYWDAVEAASILRCSDNAASVEDMDAATAALMSGQDTLQTELTALGFDPQYLSAYVRLRHAIIDAGTMRGAARKALDLAIARTETRRRARPRIVQKKRRA
jgi:hypothetical protein